jgi:MFS transporter, Spinster family, sphingosine-1-phosphate transporter
VTTKPATFTSADARFTLVVLTMLNLLNYIDRWVPSAVKPLFQADLGLTDAQTSLPFSAFVVVYMLASPLVGGLADRFPRKWIIAVGVALWSLATAAGALAGSFTTFLLARALVGVGEAAYATLSPSLLSDHYAPAQRNRVFTLFYLAMPIGSALGFVLGGKLGSAFGWRAAFAMVGLPGLLMALVALMMREPPRGRLDDAPAVSIGWKEALKRLRPNRMYLVTVAGYVAVSFAIGGIGEWFPTFLQRVHHMPIDEAGTLSGMSVVIGGLLGTLLGGFLADKLKQRWRHSYLMLPALALIPGTLMSLYVIFIAEGSMALTVGIVVCQLFLWMHNAPINALIVNSVDASLRTRAFSLSILAIHILGDVISPPIIGVASDATGNLRLACGIVALALIVAIVVWLWGALTLPADTAPDNGSTPAVPITS